MADLSSLFSEKKSDTTVDDVQQVLDTDPKAAGKIDTRGRYPLYNGMLNKVPADAIKVVVDACPEATSLVHLFKMKVAWVTAEDVQQVLDNDPEAAGKPDKDGRMYPLHYGMWNKVPTDAIKVVVDACPEAAGKPDKYGGMYPLHYGMESKVPVDAIKVVFDACPEAAGKPDGKGMYPLHHGMRNNAPADAIKVVVAACLEAAGKPDGSGRYPLHLGMQYEVPADAIKVVFDVCPEAAGELDKYTGRYPLHYGMQNNAPADAIKVVFDAHPNASFVEDKQGHTALWYGNQLGYGNTKNTYNQPDAVIQSVLHFGHGTLNPKDLHNRYFTPKETASDDDDADVHGNAKEGTAAASKVLSSSATPFSPLLNLLKAEILATAPETADAPPASAPTYQPPRPGELCRGWTPLQIAAQLGSWPAFEWLLDLPTTEPTLGQYGNPTLFDGAAVAAALASHDSKILKWGREYGRLLNTYKIAPNEKPKHVSQTCVVIIATELNNDTGKEEGVVLKFMKNKQAYQREIDNRAKIDSKSGEAKKALLIGIRAQHEIEEQDLKPFPQIKLSGEKEGTENEVAAGDAEYLKHLLVLDKGTSDLSDVISHSNIAGKSIHDALGTAVKVAKCLQYINEDCNVMHGDVKTRNFVDKGEGLGYAAIDLDAAESIDGTSFAGGKVTSSGCLPPEQAAVVLYARRKKQREAEAAEAKAVAAGTIKPQRRPSQIEREETLQELNVQMTAALEQKNYEEVARLGAAMQELEVQTSGLSTLAEPPTRVVASRAYDMWGFGVLLYQLCTGMNLFAMDVREEVKDAELVNIAGWSDDSPLKKDKMDEIDGKWPKRLIGQLLSKDPSDRPSTWSVVIDALEAVSKSDNELLIEMNRRFDQADAHRNHLAEEAAVDRANYAEANKALHATTLTTMQKEFKATRQFMVDLATTKHPYVYEVLTPEDVEVEKIAEAKDAAEEEAAATDSSGTILPDNVQAEIKVFKKKVNKAKRFFGRAKSIFNRAKDAAVSVAEFKDDPSLETFEEIAEHAKSGKTYKLRLLCGITFETVVEYEFTEKEYGPKMRKLAKVGSTIAKWAVKLGSVANYGGTVAGMFGYPIPKIPVDKIKCVQDFLDEMKGETDTEGTWGSLKEQQDEGLNLEAMEAIGALLDKLIKAGRGDDWRGKLVPWPDPNNAGMVTYIDKGQYPNHTWEVPEEKGKDAGGGRGSRCRVRWRRQVFGCCGRPQRE